MAVDPTTVFASEAGDKDGPALEEVVVTAQRREESLQRAALAVTAVTGDALVNAGVTDTSQLTAIAPALQVSTVFGPNNNFYLRGVGNFVTNVLSDNAIALNLDGVYLGRSTGAQGLFYDLDRVEVLKGPQGTLYGRNATGGAINVITAKPNLGEFGGYGQVEIGNYNEHKFTGAVNLPAGQNGALRVATQIVDREGYYSDGTGDDKSQSFRAQYALEPSDAVKLAVSADYAHQGGEGAGSTVYGLDPDDRIGVQDARAGAVYRRSFVFLAGDYLYPLQNDNYNDNTFWGVSAQADITTPIGTLVVLPAYRHSELDFLNYASSFAIPNKETDKQHSLEVRLTSDADGPWNYILGAFYMREDNESAINFDHQFASFYGQFKTETDSYAAFGRLTYSPTDDLRFSAGARYTEDRKSADIGQISAIVICPAQLAAPVFPPNTLPCENGQAVLPHSTEAPAFLFAPDGSVIPFQPYGVNGNAVTASANTLSPSKSYRKPTYRVGAEYDVSPGSLLYAAAETGFKSGGFFVTIDDPNFEPETITAYTLGSKNRFLGDTLQVNLELFHWTYKDQQVSHFRNNSQNGIEFVTENIGRTVIRGAELEVQALLLRDTLLQTTLQYLDARNEDFTYTSPASAGPPVTGCPLALVPANGVFLVDCSGRRPTQAPTWTISAGLEQPFALGSAGELRVGVHSRYQNDSYTGFEELPQQVQKDYIISDAQITYVTPSEQVTVTGFINNIEDKAAVGFSVPHPRGGAALLAEALRPPRTYGVRFGVKF